MMSEYLRNLEEDTDIMRLAENCSQVLTVIRFLVQRKLTTALDLTTDVPHDTGYSHAWFLANDCGPALQILLDSGWVEVKNGRVVLADKELKRAHALSMVERVAALSVTDPMVRTVYDGLLLGIMQSGERVDCLFTTWLKKHGYLAAAELLETEGIIRREQDPLLGEIFVLVKLKADIE